MTDFGRRPPAHNTTHQDGGDDELNAAGLAGRINYVDRGDPVSADFTTSDFTTDAQWHDLDCSAVVPAGAILIYIRLALLDDLVNQRIEFRQPGKSKYMNVQKVRTQVADIPYDPSFWVSCDINRAVEYLTSDTTFTLIYLYILGWLI